MRRAGEEKGDEPRLGGRIQIIPIAVPYRCVFCLFVFVLKTLKYQLKEFNQESDMLRFTMHTYYFREEYREESFIRMSGLGMLIACAVNSQ